MILVWIALYSWRPFILGFYEDDFVCIVPFARHIDWHEVVRLYAPRPLSGLIFVGGAQLLGAHPFLWQLASALVMLAIAFEIRKFTGSQYASVAWLVLPTAMGSAAWPSMLPGIIAAWLFMRCANSRSGLMYYALSLFTYEAFYFQFIPLLIWRKDRRGWLGFSLIQVAAISWNRFVATHMHAVSKSFAANWFLIFVGSFYRLPHELAMAFNPVQWLALVIGLLLAAVYLWYRPRQATIALGGALLSTLVYALASYGLTATGIFSRTFLVVNLWFAIGFAYLSKDRLKWAFIVACAVATIYRTIQWG